MPETTQAKIDAMLAHLLALIWERGEALRQHGPQGSKSAVFCAQTIVELAKAVKELGYALEFFNMTEPEPDEQPDAPQTEPAEWDQEQPTETAPDEESHQ